MKSFKQFLADTNCTISQRITERVTTSGYDDRYLTQDTIYTLTMDVNGKPVEVKFDFDDKLQDFILQMNGGYEDGMDCMEFVTAVREITTLSFYISGRIDMCRSAVVKLSSKNNASINAYLHLYTGRPDSYTEKHIAECREQLEKHPLPADVLAIVKNQIADCDELNAKRKNS